MKKLAIFLAPLIALCLLFSACGISTAVTNNRVVTVTVTNKTSIPQDASAGRYSDRVEFTFKIENLSDKPIKGIQGILHVNDLLGNRILSINCDFTGKTIPSNGSIIVNDIGIDINQFMDSHVMLYNGKFEDLEFEYEVSNIVYSDNSSETAIGGGTEDEQSMSKVTVNVTDKRNLEENFNEGRYSPRVEFSFSIVNNSSKAIKGVQGTLHVKDLFGIDIMSINCDFTGKTIPANGIVTFDDLGIDINQFMDSNVKLYNEAYSDLIFEYEVKTIVYEDGSRETLG